MKNIIICGDSLFCKSHTAPGTHFGEIIADKLNSKVEYFAGPGLSNALICALIDHAINCKPDLIIFNTVVPGRIELPYQDSPDIKFTSKHISDAYPHSMANNDTYLIGLPLNTDWENFTMISGIVDQEEKIESVKSYLNYIFNPYWKAQTDVYMILGILQKLELSKIRYIWGFDRLQCDDYADFSWISPKSDLREQFRKIYSQNKNMNFKNDPGYHTLPQLQIKLANIIIENL